MAITLIGGAVRSGKSRYALERARACGSRLVFLATAQALDEEMTERIAQHRAERGTDFLTWEEPIELAPFIASASCDALVVDCLTLWLSNLMHAGRPVQPAWDDAIAAARASEARVFCITNEVGAGIVPENALAREFRDLSGSMNQRFAAAADEVYWMVFGQPLKVK